MRRLGRIAAACRVGAGWIVLCSKSAEIVAFDGSTPPQEAVNEALVECRSHSRRDAFGTGQVARALVMAALVPVDDGVLVDHVRDTTAGPDQAVDAIANIGFDASDYITLQAGWAPAGEEEDHSVAHCSSGIG